MMDLIRIGASFTLIVVLLRLRWNLGVVMLLGAIFLGSLYLIGPTRQAKVILASSIDMVTINLVTGLVLIMVMENIIRKKGVLKRLMEAVVNVVRDRRIAMAVLPGVIGLLPSAGGAAFSAPMVQEAAADVDMKPEHKAFINYWIQAHLGYIAALPRRHACRSDRKTPINGLLLSQLPLPSRSSALARSSDSVDEGQSVAGKEIERSKRSSLRFCLLPFRSSGRRIQDTAGTGNGIHHDCNVCVLPVFHEGGSNHAREGISMNVMLMVIRIMVFKGMLDATGAIEALPVFFRQSGLPTGLVFFILPFIVGLLTGLTVAFVGTTFPIITAMMGGSPDLGVITFAFASGFAGVMLYPTHLCLLLTIRYFNADIAGTYRLCVANFCFAGCSVMGKGKCRKAAFPACL
jgi:hypothetical protein